MRIYFVALLAGLVLAVSAFLPWVYVGDTGFGGVPDPAGLWLLALGAAAVALSALSIATRRSSRHPLLLVGLAALGTLTLGYRLLSHTAENHAWAAAQAIAVVDHVEAPPQQPAVAGLAVYVAFPAALFLVLFGLTIIVRRSARQVEPTDDDV
ncbi:MAG TPA: hypothetical protein VNI83_07740 [Vicinamibacterales bacterium]|nr:hypothetical protein [Vicinamibacterales bacterium]